MLIDQTLTFSSACLGKRQVRRFLKTMEREGYPFRVNGQWIEVDIPWAWKAETVRFWAKADNLIEY